MLRKSIFMGALAAFALSATAALADFKPLKGDPDQINFGIISTESTQNLRTAWGPFLKDMEKALGMPVKPFFATDYAGVIEAMRFGKVHAAWFGNKSAMEAVDRAGAEVFVQEIKADGTQGYYSHILVPKGSPIHSLKDLLKCDRSLDFGMGDPNSTSGFLVPSYYVFAKNNVDPKKCFKTVRNANHETNLMAVAHRQVDAAANNSEQIARSKKTSPEAAANVRILWTSPLIPGDPITYRRDLSKGMKAKIKSFFLGYGRLGSKQEIARQKAVLKAMGSGGGGYTDSNNSQLYPIRQLALFKKRLKIANDRRLDSAEKKKRLSEIDEKLAVLNVLTKASVM